MSVAGMPKWSLRLEQAEYSRLAWACAISLAIHLLLLGTWQMGRKLHWWEQWHWPAWMQSAKMLTEVLKKKDLAQQQRQQAQPPVPIMFLDVNPAQESLEAPKEATYYSDRNSRAANPDTSIDSKIPKIDGLQKDIPKVEDIVRAKNFPLQPTLKPAETAPEVQEEIKPQPAYTPGDLAMARPDPKPRSSQGQAAKSRPRTIREALARMEKSGLVGQKMKQEGGVKRHNLTSSLDAIATPFGAYDRAIVEAVQNRWYDLLDQRRFAGEGTGKVTLRFNLNSDGSVSEMTLVDSTVDYTLALICQSAVQDPAPYAPWPGDMKKLIGGDHRQVTFTFYYH